MTRFNPTQWSKRVAAPLTHSNAMQDEWTTVISDGRLVKFTCDDLWMGAVFMTAQIAGHEVVYSIISKEVEGSFSHADVERRFTFELRPLSN
jgi:hypothetical protein